MNIDVIVKDIQERTETISNLVNSYEAKANQILQDATVAFSDTANEANEQDFALFNAIVKYIESDLNRTKQFFNFISMKRQIFINALEETDFAMVQFNVGQEDQFRRQADRLQVSLSKYEYLDKFKETLSDMSVAYHEPYREVLIEIQSLIASRHHLLDELQGVNNDIESIRDILEISLSTGKLPRDLVLGDITHVVVEVGGDLPSYINALTSIESGISDTSRDTTLDVFLPQQLCHVKP